MYAIYVLINYYCFNNMCNLGVQLSKKEGCKAENKVK